MKQKFTLNWSWKKTWICLNFHHWKNADLPRWKKCYTWYEAEQRAGEKKTYYRWKYEAGFVTAYQDGEREKHAVSQWSACETEHWPRIVEVWIFPFSTYLLSTYFVQSNMTSMFLSDRLLHQ